MSPEEQAKREAAEKLAAEYQNKVLSELMAALHMKPLPIVTHYTITTTYQPTQPNEKENTDDRARLN